MAFLGTESMIPVEPIPTRGHGETTSMLRCSRGPRALPRQRRLLVAEENGLGFIELAAPVIGAAIGAGGALGGAAIQANAIKSVAKTEAKTAQILGQAQIALQQRQIEVEAEVGRERDQGLLQAFKVVGIALAAGWVVGKVLGR
jgi:hypothetical protein